MGDGKENILGAALKPRGLEKRSTMRIVKRE
ncbi:MAG: hypothetical protein PWP39_1559 [Pyrococcus sp.]|nr:hypothetical protein [Pyrococcus sp.]